ncbi:ArsA family ATPase [Streptomyces tsukubensis]|uniref:Anion-transporting ATPase n=1 Tax=Streptomyces tsukubensis TaxID=83656 RepID=A0A1V4ABU5_9ACTN|nr:anion-transporting ATPase [Streptomyces tsukubensis]QFR97873.1 ArsA family ATPase [Streptomyces tsukubensis]
MDVDAPRPLDVDALLDDPGTRIVVCCGSGGVGKTTTAAALGLRAAERGRKAVVLTIDPARRLAQSMGIDALDNTPRRVDGIKPSPAASHAPGGPAGSGVPGVPGGASGGGSDHDRDEGGNKGTGTGGDTAPVGELHAMMLDMKRTFDEIVESHADADRARAILENPFYQSLSAGFAGTQEYMAMEKLGQLRSRDAWDLIIVDTPPSRSALDFLDAPKNLGSFLDGKFIRVLMAPAKAGGRAGMKFLNVGMSMMTGTLGKLLGGPFLRDVQTFVAAMDTMFGGFRTRADATYRLLQAPGTAFLVVAAPERDALREAAYFVERLAAEDMPLAGLVLNRVHGSGAAQLSAERALAAAENLEDGRIVDQTEGKAAFVNTSSNGPGSEQETAAPAVELDPVPPTDTPPADGAESARSTTEDRSAPEKARVKGAEGAAEAEAGTEDSHAPEPVEHLTAGLLRLHAERMRLLAREQRTRDRFTALHPEVAVAEVAALPGDVHDLAGLRAIGDRLAAGGQAGTTGSA